MAFGTPAGADQFAPYRAGFVQLPSTPMATAVQKPHFFGQGGVGRSIAGFIGDALLQMTGHPSIYSVAMERQQQAAREEEQYQRHRHDAFDTWEQQQQWTRDHPQTPEPSTYEREVQASGLQPGTPEYQARINSHLNAVDDPIVTVNLPGNKIYSGPRSGLATALSGSVDAPPKPVGKLTPLGAGGPTSGSGGFRARKH